MQGRLLNALICYVWCHLCSSCAHVTQAHLGEAIYEMPCVCVLGGSRLGVVSRCIAFSHFILSRRRAEHFLCLSMLPICFVHYRTTSARGVVCGYHAQVVNAGACGCMMHWCAMTAVYRDASTNDYVHAALHLYQSQQRHF